MFPRKVECFYHMDVTCPSRPWPGIEAPDKPGKWMAKHKEFGSQLWAGDVTIGESGKLFAFMVCNIEAASVEQLNAAGWFDWQPAKQNNPSVLTGSGGTD